MFADTENYLVEYGFVFLCFFFLVCIDENVLVANSSKLQNVISADLMTMQWASS